MDALINAITEQDIEQVKSLINSGCSVNLPDGSGVDDSPLAMAVYVQDLAIVKLLVESGANLNAKDFMNNTANDICCNIMQELKNSCADITARVNTAMEISEYLEHKERLQGAKEEAGHLK
jgi:hypothetical protein